MAITQEQIRQQKHKYYLANKAVFIEKARRWSLNNPEKRKEIANRCAAKRYKNIGSTDSNREKAQAWQKNNPHLAQAKNAKRRALRKNAFVEKVDRNVLFIRDGGVCGICLEPVDPTNFHVEHKIPLCLGGKHSYDNTRISHPHCNFKKGKKLP